MNRPNCTWMDPAPTGRCQAPAAHPQKDKEGQTWANLCEAHHKELNTAADVSRKDWKPGPMMRAGGGAEAMAKRIL